MSFFNNISDRREAVGIKMQVESEDGVVRVWRLV